MAPWQEKNKALLQEENSSTPLQNTSEEKGSACGCLNTWLAAAGTAAELCVVRGRSHPARLLRGAFHGFRHRSVARFCFLGHSSAGSKPHGDLREGVNSLKAPPSKAFAKHKNKALYCKVATQRQSPCWRIGESPSATGRAVRLLPLDVVSPVCAAKPGPERPALCPFPTCAPASGPVCGRGCPAQALLPPHRTLSSCRPSPEVVAPWSDGPTSDQPCTSGAT